MGLKFPFLKGVSISFGGGGVGYELVLLQVLGCKLGAVGGRVREPELRNLQVLSRQELQAHSINLVKNRKRAVRGVKPYQSSLSSYSFQDHPRARAE